jgi:glycosyltransferase involved in cell wall biosynthesis
LPKAPNLTVIRAARPPFVRRVPIGFSWRKLACDIPLSAKLLALARTGRYRVLHAVEEAVFPAVPVAAACGLKLVYDMDSSIPDQLVEKWPRLAGLRAPLEWAERWAMRRADAVLPVCQALADKAARHAPDTPRWILHDVAFEAAEAAEVEDLRAVHGFGGPLVLYVGNLESYQGIDLLLRGFSRTAGGTLVVIGGLERHIEEKRALARALGVEGRVLFLGPRPVRHLSGYLGQADVLASPRLKGVNTPMKLYSYMLAGKAICATDIASHRQAVDEDCATLAPPEPEAYGRALERLTKDARLRERLGAAARLRVRSRFSYELYRERLLAAYRSLGLQNEARGVRAGRAQAADSLALE